MHSEIIQPKICNGKIKLGGHILSEPKNNNLSPISRKAQPRSHYP